LRHYEYSDFYNSQRIKNRGNKDDQNKHGCNIFDHDSKKLSLLEFPGERNLFFKGFWLQEESHENAGCQRHDGHQEAVADKIDALGCSRYAHIPSRFFAVKLLERNQGENFISKKLSQLFSPTLIGANTASKKYEDIIADEKARNREAERTTAAISDLISRVAEDIDKDD
jgi:hypothetical protein